MTDDYKRDIRIQDGATFILKATRKVWENGVLRGQPRFYRLVEEHLVEEQPPEEKPEPPHQEPPTVKVKDSPIPEELHPAETLTPVEQAYLEFLRNPDYSAKEVSSRTGLNQSSLRRFKTNFRRGSIPHRFLAE